jgi:hypothetical protein
MWAGVGPRGYIGQTVKIDKTVEAVRIKEVLSADYGD